MDEKEEVREFPPEGLLDDWLAGKAGADTLQQWLDEYFPVDMKDEVLTALQEDTGQDLDNILDSHYKELKEELLTGLLKGGGPDLDDVDLDDLAKSL